MPSDVTPRFWYDPALPFAEARSIADGRPIADVALEAGIADQAHLQRAFKRHVAATPGQYRR